MRTLTMTLVAVAIVATSVPVSAATSSELIACHKTLHKSARYVEDAVFKATSCMRRAVECKLADEIDARYPTSCLAFATDLCDTLPAKVGGAQTKYTAKAAVVCGVVPLAELEPYLAGLGFYHVSAACSAATVNDLVGCVLAGARCSAEQQLIVMDPRAADSFAAIGLGGAFPCAVP